MQGKSTRPTPLIPVDNTIEIPAELMENMNKDLELAIDVMFINKQIYLTSIDRTIIFKAVVPRPTREDPDLLEGIKVIVDEYEKAGYNVIRMHADKEFESLIGDS